MAKVLIIAQCKDPVKWEQGFRTHGDLFRTQTLAAPISYGMGEGNQIAVFMEPNDLAACLHVLHSPATAEAMEFDGILRDTVKMFVLDREVQV